MTIRIPTFVLSMLTLVPVAHAEPDVDVLAADAIGERPAALALADDGSVVVVGEDGDEGIVVRLDAAGDPLVTIARERGVHDVAIDSRRGRIAIVDAAELAVLSLDLDLLWRAPLPAGDASVDLGTQGTLAVATGGELLAFAIDGDALGGATLEGTATSVAVLDDEGLVVAGGWRSTCDGAVDAPLLVGFATDGSERWRAFGAVDCNHASARIVEVARGEDGLVYALAQAEGSIHGLSSASDVAFDPLSTPGDTAGMHAHYVRVAVDGTPQFGQAIGFADPDAVVRPAGIAADPYGNVVVTGMTTHGIETDDDVVHAEPLFAEAGFYTMLRSDFRGRFGWLTLDRDDAATASTALALAGPRAVTLLTARRLPDDDVEPSSLGPSVITWPTDPDKAIPKRPDREDVGTFGYESGIAGSDPTCYACGPTRQPGAFGVLALFAVLLGLRPRVSAARRRERA